jgi:hypothetical protein
MTCISSFAFNLKLRHCIPALVIMCVFLLNALVLPPLTVLYVRHLDGRSYAASLKALCGCGCFSMVPYEDPGRGLHSSTSQLNLSRS